MPSKPKYFVWVWFDGNDPVYVGWGKMDLCHPAVAFFLDQQLLIDSELGDWLRGLPSEPKRVDQNCIIPLSRYDARTLAEALRKQYKAEGFGMMDARPRHEKIGGGRAKKVVNGDGVVFDSLRRAAYTVDVDPATIVRWCRDNVDGWHYQEVANANQD